jgi:hypothetical protein
MTEEKLKELVEYIYEGEDEKFIKYFKENSNEDISYLNNALLKSLYQILDEEYLVFGKERIEKIRNILYYIIDHKSLKMKDEETGGEELTKTIIVASLLTSFGNERIKEFESDNLYAPILAGTTALICKNDVFKNILEGLAPTEETKKQIAQNNEFISTIITKLVQGRNNEGFKILIEVFGENLIIYPFDILLIGTKYGNVEILKDFLKDFNEFKEHPDKNLIDLLETAFLNKTQSEEVLNLLLETEPIKKFVEEKYLTEEFKERRERLGEVLKQDNSPLLKKYEEIVNKKQTNETTN